MNRKLPGGKSQQADCEYLSSAPQFLIERHQNNSGFPGRPILGRLLQDSRMAKPWDVLKKSLTTDEHWEGFWQDIAHALLRVKKLGQQISKDPRNRSRTKAAYGRIAESTSKLGASLKDGPLDIPAYRLFPADVMGILGAENWAILQPLEQTQVALRLLKTWPTVSEILDELAEQAKHLATDALKGGEVKRTTREAKARCLILNLLKNSTGAWDKVGPLALATITSVVLQMPVSGPFVTNLKRPARMRKMRN